jgi:hypothetical protein
MALTAASACEAASFSSSSAWVEFEAGDPGYPIWSGCFWGAGQVPVKPPVVAGYKVLRTEGIEIMMNDVPGEGGLTLQVFPPTVPVPLKIVLDAQGIELTAGAAVLKLGMDEIKQHLAAASIVLSPTQVSINNGALEVT